MDWLRENWIWLFILLAFIGMHIGGHGHGMHGGHGHGGHGNEDGPGRNEPGRGEADGDRSRHADGGHHAQH